jgi:NTE family protein
MSESPYPVAIERRSPLPRSARCSAARSTYCSAVGRSITRRLARLFSPYDLAFGTANPLAKVPAESIDFARLADASIKLFVTATNVRTALTDLTTTTGAARLIDATAE